MLRELSQAIAYLTSLKGSLATKSDNNVSMTPFTGDTDYADEILASDTNPTAIIGLHAEPHPSVNETSNILFGSEVYEQEEFPPTMGMTSSTEAIHQAISQGEDPGDLLEATASGSGPVTEGGHGFVRIGLGGQHTTPESGTITSQQPLDFSNTLDITGIQENDISNSVTFTSITLTDNQETTPPELNPNPEITDVDILDIEEPSSSSFTLITTSHTPTSGFETQGPSIAPPPPPPELLIIPPGEVL